LTDTNGGHFGNKKPKLLCFMDDDVNSDHKVLLSLACGHKFYTCFVLFFTSTSTFVNGLLFTWGCSIHTCANTASFG